MRRITGLAFLAAGLLAAAGCGDITPRLSLIPPARPDSLAPPPPSEASQQLAVYYAGLERDLLTRGLLRTDGGGPESNFDAGDLVRNFEAIAFYQEYGSAGISAPGTAGALTRWEDPVRLTAVFGPSVSEAARSNDADVLERYAGRLSRLTGHPVSVTPQRRSNFTVIFAGMDDDAFVGEQVRKAIPQISSANLQLFMNPPRSYYCMVLAASDPDNPVTYNRAVALIRAEHPTLVRESCIHEEIAQGLGLSNDSPRARPSIFNDDDEFALLTSHDEKLLTMLYDPRLEPGMSAEQARPVTRIIARELMGQEL
jgi:hypothetical protein